jgi:ribulose-phosphate 3-epimerase
MAAALPEGRRVVPSILSADFSRLGEQVAEVMEAGARVIQVDVMDGHFVPPITMGPLVVDALREQTHNAGGYLDVHLMVERPERHVQAFAEAGADGITVHYEATPNVHYALKAVREAGCRPGLALNPGTPADVAAGLGDVAGLVLCMTVNPGWGGQEFIQSSPARVARLRELLPDDVVIEVDGGIDEQTAPVCANAGASLLVAGSAVFGSSDPAESYRRIAASIGAL